jgi:hypothetical protein
VQRVEVTSVAAHDKEVGRLRSFAEPSRRVVVGDEQVTRAGGLAFNLGHHLVYDPSGTGSKRFAEVVAPANGVGFALDEDVICIHGRSEFAALGGGRVHRERQRMRWVHAHGFKVGPSRRA